MSRKFVLIDLLAMHPLRFELVKPYDMTTTIQRYCYVLSSTLQ